MAARRTNDGAKKKVSDIESLEVKLAQSKAHLLTLMQLIDSKPEDVDCKDNAARVMASMNITPR